MPPDRKRLVPIPPKRADAALGWLIFGCGAWVSVAFALLHGLRPDASGAAGGGTLVLIYSALALAFGGGALAAQRHAAAPAVLACCWATVLAMAAVAYATGHGVRGLPLGFMALAVCLGGVLVSLRAALGLAAGSGLMLAALTGVELGGGLLRADDESLLPALVTQVLLLLTALAAAAAVSRSLAREMHSRDERERRFQALMAIAADWYWEQDEQLRFTRMFRVDGEGPPLDPHGLMGLHRWDLPEIELTEAQWAAHRAELDARRPFRDFQMRLPDLDGQPRFIMVSGEPAFGPEGRFRGYWGVGRNVTGRVLADRAARATDARYRELFARSPSPLLLHRRGIVVEGNDAAVRLLGYADAAAMVGVDIGVHYEPGAELERARARTASLHALPLGTSLPLADFTLHRLDGSAVEVQVSSLRVALDDGPAVLSIYRDVTAQRRAERALERSQTLLTQLFATTPDAVSLSEIASGRYVMLNERFSQVFGWTQEEAVGRTSIELGIWRRPADREHLLALLAEHGTVRDVPLVYGSKSGALVRLAVSAARFRLGDADYLVVIGRDVSEVQIARLEREAILQHASIGVALMRGGRFVQVNSAFEKLLGWGPGELVGQPGSVVWPSEQEYSEINRLAGPVLAAGKPFEAERVARRRDGSQFWARIQAQVVDPDDPTGGGTIWVGEDVTQRRAAERALADARDAAEAASRAKSAFLANTSHEIRTPLNALLGLARLARDPALDDARRARYLDQIVDSAQSLSAVISDILDLSKIEAGKLELESVPFALHDLVVASCRGFEALADAAGLTLELEIDADVPPVVRGDPVRLRQILANYLANALKFTERGGVRVALSSDGDELLLRVADTGPGIDAATQARLFSPFTQADDSTTRRHGGTGLGLSICRELAELMGGEVGVESAPGRGSSFWARLPLPRAAAAEVGPCDDERVARVLAGARVLLVEDNPVNMMIAAAMLEQWQVRVSQAADGQQALDAVARAEAEGTLFDAVLMDVQMPVMSGHEAAKRLRERHDAQALPIVALTAAALVGEREQALAAGMDAFLTKPIDMEQLKRTLARAVGGREAVPSAMQPLGR